MPTARTLCIAGGGGGQDGGGGAGGMLDENINLDHYKEYEIVVGSAGSSGSDGQDSYVKPKDLTLDTYSYNLSIPFDGSQTKNIDVSQFSDHDGLIAVEIDVSGTDEFDGEGVFDVQIDNQTVYGGELFDYTYYYDASSILNGQSNVDIYAEAQDQSPTLTFNFIIGYKIKSIGGGRGGGFESRARLGGSGGGGGQSEDYTRPGIGTPGQGNSGGGGDPGDSTFPEDSAGGGGGASQSGEPGDGGNGGNGGDGQSSNITGSSTTYAGGGGGNGDNDGASGAGANNYGGGGSFGQGGQPGVVIFRYNPDNFIHEFQGGDNVYEVSGDKVHEFTSDGTLEPVLSGTAFFALD